MIRKGRKCDCVIGTGHKGVPVSKCPVHGDKVLQEGLKRGD